MVIRVLKEMNKKTVAVVLIVLSVLFVGVAIYLNYSNSSLIEAGKSNLSGLGKSLGGQVKLVVEPGVAGGAK